MQGRTRVNAFSAILFKRDILRLLFAFLHHKPLLQRGLLRESKFFTLRIDPFVAGRQNNFDSCFKVIKRKPVTMALKVQFAIVRRCSCLAKPYATYTVSYMYAFLKSSGYMHIKKKEYQNQDTSINSPTFLTTINSHYLTIYVLLENKNKTFFYIILFIKDSLQQIQDTSIYSSTFLTKLVLIISTLVTKTTAKVN